jgi:hypothetical protein
MYEKFNPWTLFFTDARVINRISNYNLLRAKLHVKFLINGNSLHYGRAICSYIPLHNSDDLSLDNGLVEQVLVQSSQRPHVFLDPTTSQGGELVLPFFWYNNWLSIPNEEWDEMGVIAMHEMNALKHANGATDTVTITVLAWAEDVELAVPTSTNPGSIALQGGDEFDSKGAVSGPASSLAATAGVLSNIPLIAPYAKASQMAMSTIAGMARIFGYSRPPIIDPPIYNRPTALGNLANTDAKEAVYKLTVDSKQELTLDSRTVGLDGTDELAINYIAQKESYLFSSPWPVAFASETCLFSIPVRPSLYRITDLGDGDARFPTALDFATIPFRYWRGSIKFRIQVVASAFHKGRIRVVYDPVSYLDSSEYNTNYAQIMDIATCRDTTIVVPWGSTQSFKEVQNSQSSDPFNVNDGLAGASERTASSTFDNGVLSVYVLNDLTVPAPTVDNDCYINVYVSAGDDFTVAVPSKQINKFSPFPQDTELASGEDFDSIPSSNNEPEETAQCEDINQHHMDPPDNSMSVFFGESIVSFRPLLKRYELYRSDLGTSSTDNLRVKEYIRLFPLARGDDPDGVHTNQYGSTNFTRMTLMSYLSLAFVGYRGAIRHKIALNGELPNCTMSLTNNNGHRVNSISRATLQLTTGDEAEFGELFTNDECFLPGSAITHTTINPTLEVEFPYYDSARFTPVRNLHTNAENAQAGILSYVQPANSTFFYRDDFLAAGEDFNLFFYLAPARLYFYDSRA